MIISAVHLEFLKYLNCFSVIISANEQFQQKRCSNGLTLFSVNFIAIVNKHFQQKLCSNGLMCF